MPAVGRTAIVLAIAAVQPAPAQDGFCPPGYAAVADSVAAQFDTHQFVIMGSTHGWKKQHEFQLCLLSRPAFQRRTTDVMVEWANPVYSIGPACMTAAALCAQAPACAPPDTTAGWARVKLGWQRETSWTHDSLRRVLLSLKQADQAARADFGRRVRDSAYVRQLMAVDSALSAAFTTILDRFGLPTKSLVGAAGADAAMLLVQHSATLQERVLALAKAAPPGEVSPEAVAMLEDRVLVHQGRPQRFGTQFTLGPDGVFRFAPVEDRAHLDRRRAAAGLLPLAQYVCLLEQEGLRIDRTSLPAHAGW